MNRINKYVDLLDRLVWTFIQCFLGYTLVDALSDSVNGDWKATLSVAGVAALIAAGKTVVAQNIGDSGLGDAIPGASVVETESSRR
jgi:hypothetical protein